MFPAPASFLDRLVRSTPARYRRRMSQQHSSDGAPSARKWRVLPATVAVLGAFGAVAAGAAASSLSPTSDTAARSTSAARTVTVARASLPVFIAGRYHGRRPRTIDISGDGGDIVTALRWSSWRATSATGTGTSNIQHCVPNCAEGTDIPVSTSIKLTNPVHGYFTRLIERRDGQTEVFRYTPGHRPDNWPGGAS